MFLGGMDTRVERAGDVLGYIMGKHNALVGMEIGGGLWDLWWYGTLVVCWLAK